MMLLFWNALGNPWGTKRSEVLFRLCASIEHQMKDDSVALITLLWLVFHLCSDVMEANDQTPYSYGPCIEDGRSV